LVWSAPPIGAGCRVSAFAATHFAATHFAATQPTIKVGWVEEALRRTPGKVFYPGGIHSV